jgi:four helix bundle protein
MTSTVKTFRDLDCWRLAVELRRECYRIANDIPSHDRFGLADQLRRAAASVPANIAKGHGRNSRREFAQVLGIARGSLTEIENHLLEATDGAPHLATTRAIVLCKRTRMVVNALIRALHTTPHVTRPSS